MKQIELTHDDAAKMYFGKFAYSNERHVAELYGFLPYLAPPCLTCFGRSSLPWTDDGWTVEDLEELEAILVETRELKQRIADRDARMRALADRIKHRRQAIPSAANRARRQA